MDGFLRSGIQRMPAVERLVFVNEPIRTGLGQPVKMCGNIGWTEYNAIRDELMSYRIARTQACRVIKQPACDGGEFYVSALRVLKFVHAAFAATIAERFPFLWCHMLQFLVFPKLWFDITSLDFVGHGVLSLVRAWWQSWAI